MAEIMIYVLQTPRILEDDSYVALPYKKAEALLYYLAVEKTATRDKLAALLWDTCDEATAKKNVRHALYTIRKNFHRDLILSPDRQNLRLNPEIHFYIDYDELVEGKDMRVYETEFMNGFYVKNAYPYEEWLTWKRSSVKNSYLKILEENLRDTDRLPVETAEVLFEQYKKEEPLDEQAYFYMMKVYERERMYYRGIRIYQQLAAVLDRELKVNPKKEITSLYRSFLEVWKEETAEESSREPEGHVEELRQLLGQYRDFLAGVPKAVLLSGESGVGKTYLAEQFLRSVKKEGHMLLKVVCLETEQEMKLQPWNVVMMQMAEAMQAYKIEVEERYLQAADSLFPFFHACPIKENLLQDTTLPYSYRSVRNLFLNFLVQSAEKVPLILFFDNIQYMDFMSLELLSLIIRTRNSRIMFLLSGPDVCPERLRKYMTPLTKERYIERIFIMPFTKEEARSVIQKKLGEKQVTLEYLDWIYEESRGNAYLLEMLLGVYAGGICRRGEDAPLQELWKAQFDRLSRGSRQVLELIAACQAWADMDSLENILKKDGLELLQDLEELKEKGIICEKMADGQIRFLFCHSNMREFVHNQMEPSKVRVLHRRLAQYIEKLPSYDSSRVQRLIYHYQLCGNKEKVLYYQVRSLAEYAQKFYELYPMYLSSWEKNAFDGAAVLEHCNRLEREILRLYQEKSQSRETEQLYVLLLQTKAQYCIPQGYYEEGVRCVEKAMNTNHAGSRDLSVTLHCLRFLIYHQLNVWELEKTATYLKEAFCRAQEAGLKEEEAVICRLNGLYLSMIGNFEESLYYLRKSLGFFEGAPLKSRVYALNISACYNYMGEVMRKTRRFEQALSYYEKAALVCAEQQYPCNAVVYSNIGRTYLAMGRKGESEKAFALSDELYEESYTLLGRSMTKAYLALLKAEQGDGKKAGRLLQEARASGQQLASPYTLGILSLVEAELSGRFRNLLGGLLEDTTEGYLEKAKGYLEGIPGAYEMIVANKAPFG